MSNFSLTSALITIAVFFTLLAIVLTTIHVTNPITNGQENLFTLLLKWAVGRS